MFKVITKEMRTLQALLVLAAPMIVSQGAFAVMIFCDRYFLSQVSPTHMAAALGGGVAVFFCQSLFIGVLAYGNAIVAHNFGAGDFHKCSKVMTQAALLSLISLPILMLIGYFVADLFAAMGHAKEQLVLEKQYFFALLLMSPLQLLKVSIASYFAGISRTKVVMAADTLGVLMNIPLSYGFVFGVWGLPELGILGAALGTAISMAFSLAVYALFYFHPEHRRQFAVADSWGIDRGILRRYLRLGLPSGIETFLNVAAFNLFLLMFQSYGVVEGASSAIVLNWDIMSFVPMMGLSIAIVSMVGRSVGAGNVDGINQVIRSGFMLSISYSVVLGLLYLIFRHELVAIFVIEGPEAEQIKVMAGHMMLGLVSYTVADAIILVSGGVLRGIGDTRWMMVVSVSLHWLMLLAQVVVIRILEWGPQASWNLFVMMIVTTAVVYLWRLSQRRWQDKEVMSGMLAKHA
ncbi:MATE family multidrug resistance protein [Sinobacterium caligoides]|uniref:Multidrug-efflux transporter n=1 Tax=Sinobacterium caligoides TaxID=933926 RepID=A0A3N2DPI5_9GAMM|nr:MATE family efflux transporter [Sinobacterium caligoides]ROS01728.1 MATE family multidrug resistance protein [Sinobacterium caligoides]